MTNSVICDILGGDNKQMNTTAYFEERTYSMKYTFKRKFYKELISGIQNYFITALLGPRKCGKTVALLQLNEELPLSKYYDAKMMREADQNDLYTAILKSIQNNEEVIYIIDELTYINSADLFVEGIAVESRRYRTTNVHIVFTGSQSFAIKSWIGKSFSSCAKYVFADFINYSEWLLYKQYDKATEENYIEFLINVDKFYNMDSLCMYLHTCLEETVISNYHSVNLILNNNVDDLNEQVLLDVLFATLVTLRNHTSYAKFRSNDMLYNALRFSYPEACQSHVEDIRDIVDKYYATFSRLNIQTIIQALIFLSNCKLIRLFEVGEEKTFGDLEAMLTSYSSDEKKAKIFTKESLFRSINVTIAHPMFFIALVKEALGFDESMKLSGSLLGGIVECHCRGLLPTNAFEFQTVVNDVDREIDYVNPDKGIAVEFTISNNHGECFDLLAGEYACVRLSQSLRTSWQTDKGKMVQCLPYYEFIAQLSK